MKSKSPISLSQDWPWILAGVTAFIIWQKVKAANSVGACLGCRAVGNLPRAPEVRHSIAPRYR